MVFLFDHTTSIVVSMAVVMVLFGVQMRAQRSSITRTQMYMAKKQTLSLANVLEHDLVNVGYDRNPTYQKRILEYETQKFSQVKSTKRFVFRGIDGAGDSAPIRYTIEEAGEAVIDGRIIKLVQFERAVCRPSARNDSDPDHCAPGGWESSGVSAPSLTRFHIKFFKSGGVQLSEAGNPDEQARTLEVILHTAVAPGVNQDDYLKGNRQLFWKVRLRPGGLEGAPGS